MSYTPPAPTYVSLPLSGNVNLFKNIKAGYIDISGAIINSSIAHGNVEFKQRPTVSGVDVALYTDVLWIPIVATSPIITPAIVPNALGGSGTTISSNEYTYLTGLVGINNTAPFYTLDVNGPIGNSLGGLEITAGTYTNIENSIPGYVFIHGGNGVASAWNRNGGDVYIDGGNSYGQTAGNVIIAGGHSNTYYESFPAGYVNLLSQVLINQNINSGTAPKFDLEVIGSGNFSSGLYVSGVSVLTGVNLTNYVTVNQTGSFVTTSNASFIVRPTVNGTGILLSGEAVSVQTGTLTGVFYPLLTNPSGYITTQQTGSFVTTSNASFIVRPTVNGTGVLLSGEAASIIANIVYTTGNQNISGVKNFYSRPTVNGTGILLSGEAVSVQTGTLTGVFYPLLTNPSGYITTAQTGSFVSQTSGNIYASGFQLFDAGLGRIVTITCYNGILNIT